MREILIWAALCGYNAGSAYSRWEVGSLSEAGLGGVLSLLMLGMIFQEVKKQISQSAGE